MSISGFFVEVVKDAASVDVSANQDEISTPFTIELVLCGDIPIPIRCAMLDRDAYTESLIRTCMDREVQATTCRL